MAETQQKFTQKGGVRPFGVSTFLAGFEDGSPKLYMTEPSGALSQWKANAIGKKSKELREFMEEKYVDGMNQDAATRLAIETLLEVVESEKNIELNLITGNNVSTMVDEAAIAAVVGVINKEKEEAEAAKKKGSGK